ncbi:cadherin-like protein 26 isoform X1 [Oryzias melastigma]|uniref:Cadherin 27 n=1 Tax=Oryzias melastigma TaxID=30732 RepID=A0A3B3CVE2_ORYME|nr:cadherin-like protein 26 isoform X1 [Oryzias melastigma]
MLFFFLLIYYLSSPACSEVLSRDRRTWIIATFEIEEESQGPFPYELGTVNVERKYPVYFELYGEGVDEEPEGVLSIDRKTGTIYANKAVDYEARTRLKLRFEATKSDLSIDTKLGIEITINDINDNPPRFDRDLYEIQVNEVTTQGSHLLSVQAHDRDQRGSPNSTFHYEILSVTPKTSDTEFFISELGAISFKGCLNRDVSEKFTILVEAKDHGDVISLSSSTTVVIHVLDGNNHLPIISGQTGPGKVKENESGKSPLRLHVTDEDSVNSSAWRARYTIDGDSAGNFHIETDPETNDGILTILKPLDFEEGPQREVHIIVENQDPYFHCKVEEKTPSGLWKVDIGETHDHGGAASIKAIIEVEDTNDPPTFKVVVKSAMLEENVPAGTWVERMVAVDPDSIHTRDFVYEIGSDPAGWLTVDPHTGDITTNMVPDRESPHVVDGIYTIVLLAVDDDTPPLTGSATLLIHLGDQNDNPPQLELNHVDICMSDIPTTTNITAFDLDGYPFGGPFKFELLGNVQGKWKLDPTYGLTAGLVKEAGVYAGKHTIDLKISDLQEVSAVYNLSVTVCDCLVTPNCRSKNSSTKAAFGAVGIALASLLLFLILLLMAFFFSCKEEFIFHLDYPCGETLLASNTERPGTDCKMPANIATIQHCKAAVEQSQQDGGQNVFSEKGTRQSLNSGHYRSNSLRIISHPSRNKFDQSRRSLRVPRHKYQFDETGTMGFSSNINYFTNTGTLSFLHKKKPSFMTDAALHTLLQRRLFSLQESDDLLDYEPRVYTEEGDANTPSELETISIPDENPTSFLEMLNDFDPRFKQLVYICKPVKQ